MNLVLEIGIMSVLPAVQDLPVEIIFRILKLLTPKDLKMAVLVCKRWREVGEDPSLWKWCKITLNSKHDLGKLFVARLTQIQNIRVVAWNSWKKCDKERLSKAILQLPISKQMPVWWSRIATRGGSKGVREGRSPRAPC